MWKADTLQPKNLMQVMINLKHGHVLLGKIKKKKKTIVSPGESRRRLLDTEL